jgi:hypothetical protein
MQQDIKMSRQERIEISEALLAEVGVIILGVLQPGVVSQSLTVGVEQFA